MNSSRSEAGLYLSVKPTVLVITSNNRTSDGSFLRNVRVELRGIQNALSAAVRGNVCETRVLADATSDEVYDALQEHTLRRSLAVFHYAGHAHDTHLFLDSAGLGEVPVPIRGDSLAVVITHLPSVALVFLNGCATSKQGQAMVAAGVPAVIVTSTSIDDSIACLFAKRFYAGLGSGLTIECAFSEAMSQVEATEHAPRGSARELDLNDFHRPGERWELFTSSRQAAEWTLQTAADSPLFGLPKPRVTIWPDSPFVGTSHYTRAHTNLFIGREQETRDIYLALTTARDNHVLIVYGATGVGKTSLMVAGLIPRLETQVNVRYIQLLRGDDPVSKLGEALIVSPPTEVALASGWRAVEAQTARPLVVVFDLDFNICTTDFWQAMGPTLEALKAGIDGHLVLVLDAQQLPSIRHQLHERGTLPTEYRLEPLSRDKLRSILRSPDSRDPRSYYHLVIDEPLSTRLLADLALDGRGVVAPVLQQLLTYLWTVRVPRVGPRGVTTFHFSSDLYQEELYQGLWTKLLRFQLDQLGENKAIALDLLRFHVDTSLRTIERTQHACAQRYAVPSTLAKVQEALRRVRLLHVQGTTSHVTHPIWAGAIVTCYEHSTWPSIRATKLLATIETGERSLRSADIRLLLRQRAHMRVWTQAERELIRRCTRKRRNLQVLATLAVGLICAIVFVSWPDARQNSARHVSPTNLSPQPAPNGAGQTDASTRPSAEQRARALVSAITSTGTTEHTTAEHYRELVKAIHSSRLEARWSCAQGSRVQLVANDYSWAKAQYLAICDDGAVATWSRDVREPQLGILPLDRSQYLAFARNNETVHAFTADGQLQVGQITEGGLQLTTKDARTPRAPLRRAVFDVGGKHLAVLTKDAQLIAWKTQTPLGSLLPEQPDFAFNSTGKCLYGTLATGEVGLWSPTKPEKRYLLPQISRPPQQLDFSHDASLLFVLNDLGVLLEYDLQESGCRYGEPTQRATSVKQFDASLFGNIAIATPLIPGEFRILGKNEIPVVGSSGVAAFSGSYGENFAFLDGEGGLWHSTRTTRHQLRQGMSDDVEVHFSRNGQLITVNHADIEVWSAELAQPTQQRKRHSHRENPRGAGYLASDQLVFITNKRTYICPTGRICTGIDMPHAASMLTLHPQKDMVFVAGADAMAQLLEPTDGVWKMRSLGHHTHEITASWFFNDVLLTLDTNGHLILQGIEDGSVLQQEVVPRDARAIFSGQSPQFALVTQARIDFWTVENERLRNYESVEITPTTTTFELFGEHRVPVDLVWDAKRRRPTPLEVFPLGPLGIGARTDRGLSLFRRGQKVDSWETSAVPSHAAYAAAASRLVVGDRAGNVYVYRTTDNGIESLFQFMAYPTPIEAIAISQDGHRLFVGGRQGLAGEFALSIDRLRAQACDRLRRHNSQTAQQLDVCAGT